MQTKVPFSTSSHVGEARGSHDHWTGLEARKRRKKIQNRLNQRAHRQRNNDKGAPDGKAGQRPYRVYRWRTQDCDISLTEEAKSRSTSKSDSPRPPRRSLIGSTRSLPAIKNGGEDFDSNAMPIESKEPPARAFPLSSDHLLHLIHQNVFRALLSNKDLLSRLTTLTVPDYHIPTPCSSRLLCGGYSVIHPLNSSIPYSLVPTSLQMGCPHSSWINMFPFPLIRDNLIRREAYFDHGDFCKDLFGEMVNDNLPITRDASESPSARNTLISEEGDDDAITATRRGLIVWGEPHEKDSWEVTPGFIRKWAWVLEGCDELIEASNRWRIIRGEEPIQLSPLWKHTCPG